MSNETKNTITLFFVEVGVLEDKKQAIKDEDYIPAYDEKYSYYDENVVVFMGSEEAVCYALGYVMNGVDNTYAVCKQLEVAKDEFDEDTLNEIKEMGIFEEWTEYLNRDCKHIILDIYKSAENTIKFDFTDKLKAVVSND